MLGRRLALSVLSLALAGALHAEVPVPQDTPYAPGTIKVEVDATNLAQRIFRVKETIPVQAGELTLLYPEWIPGGHSPRGAIDKVAGITFHANGQKLAWKRDTLDVHAFHVTVPEGVHSLTAEFDFLTPTDRAQGRVVMTPNMLNLQWISTLLYPAGHYGHQIQFDPIVTYPAGWTAYTALDVESTSGSTINYQDLPLDILADSPVYAGRYAKRIDLTPAGSKVPVHLDVIADAPKFLETKPEQVKVHKALVEMALMFYGAQHYYNYDLLFSVS
jgi:predicted metalloprotease with PDZ domain